MAQENVASTESLLTLRTGNKVLVGRCYVGELMATEMTRPRELLRAFRTLKLTLLGVFHISTGK